MMLLFHILFSCLRDPKEETMHHGRLISVAAFVLALGLMVGRSTAQLTLIDQTRSLNVHGDPVSDPNNSDSTVAAGIYSNTVQFSNSTSFEINDGGGVQNQTDA